MQNQISKSTFIFSIVIVVLLTFILTREFSLKQGQAANSTSIENSQKTDEPLNILAKAKSPTGKDGKEADPYEKEQVKNTIIKNAKKIQECYTAWLATTPTKLKTDIKIDWTILPDGSVQNPQIIDSSAVEMNACLIGKVSDIEFPLPPEGKSFYVAHKFSFNTEENLAKIKKEQELMEQKFNPLKK